MKDSSAGGLLAFTVVAPVMVICCGGKAARIGIALFGTAGFLTGTKLLSIALVATLGGIVVLAARTFLRARRYNDNVEMDGRCERQTS